MRTKMLTEQQDCVLLMMMRSNAGIPLTNSNTDTVTVKLSKDFTPFEAVTISGLTAAKVTPVKGTTGNPDPRWNPGVDGKDGFNLEVVIPRENFATAGTYFVSVSWAGDAQSFRVHVGSGWDGV